ncbi:MAG TPA: DUF1036 domain-containing protein [Devosia sp.]|jgi:uncharacterized membrane protein|nr:DUF1036 domain-containing protein [Devosia sp.]
MNFGWLLHPLRLALLLAGFVLMALAASAAPARADLRVCNQSTNQVSIALGYRAEKGWQSEGWWVAPSGKCAVVYQGDLHSRFFYLYVADDIGGGAWDGTNFMCTRDESFTIFGVEDCLARGYERTGFFEVDTQNRTDWTLQLTDPTNNDNTVTDNGDAAPLEGDDNASTQPDQPDQGQDQGTDGGDGGGDFGTD